jgi:hypothetical protein
MEPTTKFDGFVCIDCGKTSFAIHNAPVCTGCRHREAIRRMDYSLIRATVTVCAFLLLGSVIWVYVL